MEKTVRTWAEEEGLSSEKSFDELCQEDKIIKKMSEALLKDPIENYRSVENEFLMSSVENIFSPQLTGSWGKYLQYKMEPKVARKGYDRDSSRDSNPKMAPFSFCQLTRGHFGVCIT